MNELVLAALASGGLGAILTAVVTGIFSKKKLGAEAAEIITKAAAGVVQNLEREIERQEQLREEMKAEHAREHREWAQEREDWKRVLQLHVAWDAIAIAKMADIGVGLPPAPPLMPPIRGDVDWKNPSTNQE